MCMEAKRIFILLAVGCWLTAQGSCTDHIRPDLHWTFDFNDDHNTYEVKSALENAGAFGNGTQMMQAYRRHGLVAYFSGTFSGILIDNVSSTCFLHPHLCSTGLSFSFWMKWVNGIDQFLLMSPAISIKHLMSDRVLVELWNGTQGWTIFHGLSGKDIWEHYMITWDKAKLQIFVDGVAKEPSFMANFKNGLIGTSAGLFPTRMALGRRSTDDNPPKLPEIYLDDFKIWEQPFSGAQVLQIYNSEIYKPRPLIIENIPPAIQFTSMMSNAKYIMRSSSVIKEQLVTNLEDCYRICTNEQSCQSIGFKTGAPQSVCRIGNEPLLPASADEVVDEYHYIFVDRDN